MQNSYGKRRGQEAVNTGIRPIAPTYGRASFLSYSHRSGYTHATESANERLVSQMLDIDPSFKSHQAQPFTVDVLEQRLIHARAERNKLSATRKKDLGDEARNTLYTPDFLANRSDAPLLVLEVKLEGWEGNEEYANKLCIARRVLAANGYEFQKITVPSLWSHPLRHNVPLLHMAKASSPIVLSEEQLLLLEKAGAASGITQADACHLLQLQPAHIPALVVQGVLRLDISNTRFHNDTILTLAHGDLQHLQLLGGMPC